MSARSRSRILWTTIVVFFAWATWWLLRDEPIERIPSARAGATPGGANDIPALDRAPDELSNQRRAEVDDESELATAPATESGLIVRVFDEARAPVPGMTVVWRIDSDPEAHHGTTDSRGWFVEDLPRGHALLVTVAGQTKSANNADGPARVDFVVRHFRRISIAVTDPNGRPVDQAGIRMASKADDRQVHLAAVTDGSGHAVVDSFDARDLVSVAKDGWLATQQLPVTAAVPSDDAGATEAVWRLDFTIERVRGSDVVPGRVVDEVGRPIPDVTITWHSGARRLRHRGFLTRAPAPQTAVSNTEGRFSLALRREPGRLLARRDGLADCWLRLEPADYEGGIEVVMVAEAIVRGTVIDQAGVGVCGAQVEAAADDDTPRRTMTNALGRFVVRGLRAGTNPSSVVPRAGIQVCAFHPARGSGTQRLTVEPGGIAEAQLVLSGDTITGSVRRGAVPVPGARIRVRGTIRGWNGADWENGDFDVLASHPDGRFTIARPEGPGWGLLVEPPPDPERITAPYELPGSDLPAFVDIDLEQLEVGHGTICLVVVDTNDRPVDSYWLRLRAPGEKAGWLSFFCGSPDGRARASVPSGTYEIAVSPRGGGLLHEVGTVSVAAKAVQDLGQVAVERPASIHGTLEPPAGVEVDNDLVGLIIAHDRLPTAIMWKGSFGEWQLDDLAPARYSLRPGDHSLIDFDPQTVEVRPGKREHVRLFGRPCWRGAIRVRMGTSHRGPWVVEFRNCRGHTERRQFDVSTASNGVARIDNVHLRPGTTTVSIGAVGSPPVAHEVSNAGKDTLWIDLR